MVRIAMSHVHTRTCHCGNLRLVFSTGKETKDLFFRECQCSYCTPQGAIYCTDAEGSLEIHLDRNGDVGRYSFALRTAEFLFCKTCGCYLCAVQEKEGKTKAVINARYFPTLLPTVLKAADNIRSVNFDGESAEARTARHDKNWTPAEVINGRSSENSPEFKKS